MSQNQILRETQAQLGSQLQRAGVISQSLSHTSYQFTKIDTTMNSYQSNLGVASSLISQIRRRVTMQDIVFYILFYTFLALCAWIVLKRFGLSTILEFFIEKVSLFFSSTYTYFSSFIESSSDL